MKVLIGHLQDDRPSPLLESLATVDGSPVNYTVGDAIFFHLKGRFIISQNSYRTATDEYRNSPHLQTKSAMADWFGEHGYNLDALQADHANPVGDNSNG